MWFFILTVKYILEAHSSRELFKISQELSPDNGFVIHGCWINLRPFDSTLTWSSDSWWVERFLRNFSFNSLSLAARLFSEVFLRFLRRLFLEIPSLVLWPAFVESENTLHTWYCLSCLFAEFISTCEKTMFFKSEICFCKSDKFTLLWFTMWFFENAKWFHVRATRGNW